MYIHRGEIKVINLIVAKEVNKTNKKIWVVMSAFNGKDLITMLGDGSTASPAQCTMPTYLIFSSPLVYEVPMPSIKH